MSSLKSWLPTEQGKGKWLPLTASKCLLCAGRVRLYAHGSSCRTASLETWALLSPLYR